MNNDTKERIAAIAITGIVAFVLWMSVILTCGVMNAIPQTVEKQCDHTTDSLERFENIRLLPPAVITSFDPVNKRMYYKVSNARQVKIGSFDIEPDTAVDKALPADPTGQEVFFIYCIKDLHLYTVQKVDPKNVTRGKK